MAKAYRINLKDIPVQYKMGVRPKPCTPEELLELQKKHFLPDEYMVFLEKIRQHVFGDKRYD